MNHLYNEEQLQRGLRSARDIRSSRQLRRKAVESAQQPVQEPEPEQQQPEDRQYIDYDNAFFENIYKDRRPKEVLRG